MFNPEDLFTETSGLRVIGKFRQDEARLVSLGGEDSTEPPVSGFELTVSGLKATWDGDICGPRPHLAEVDRCASDIGRDRARFGPIRAALGLVKSRGGLILSNLGAITMHCNRNCSSAVCPG